MADLVLSYDQDVAWDGTLHDVCVSFPDMPELCHKSKHNTLQFIRDVCEHADALSLMVRHERGERESGDAVAFFVDQVPQDMVKKLLERMRQLTRETVIVRTCQQRLDAPDDDADDTFQTQDSVPYVAWAQALAASGGAQQADADVWKAATEACVALEAHMQRTMQWSEAGMLNSLSERLDAHVRERLEPAGGASRQAFPAITVRKNRTNAVIKAMEGLALDVFNDAPDARGKRRARR